MLAAIVGLLGSFLRALYGVFLQNQGGNDHEQVRVRRFHVDIIQRNESIHKFTFAHISRQMA